MLHVLKVKSKLQKKSLQKKSLFSAFGAATSMRGFLDFGDPENVTTDHSVKVAMEKEFTGGSSSSGDDEDKKGTVGVASLEEVGLEMGPLQPQSSKTSGSHLYEILNGKQDAEAKPKRKFVPLKRSASVQAEEKRASLKESSSPLSSIRKGDHLSEREMALVEKSIRVPLSRQARRSSVSLLGNTITFSEDSMFVQPHSEIGEGSKKEAAPEPLRGIGKSDHVDDDMLMRVEQLEAGQQRILDMLTQLTSSQATILAALGHITEAEGGEQQ
jgi:hypothetical protein